MENKKIKRLEIIRHCENCNFFELNKALRFICVNSITGNPDEFKVCEFHKFKSETI